MSRDWTIEDGVTAGMSVAVVLGGPLGLVAGLAITATGVAAEMTRRCCLKNLKERVDAEQRSITPVAPADRRDAAAAEHVKLVDQGGNFRAGIFNSSDIARSPPPERTRTGSGYRPHLD